VAWLVQPAVAAITRRAERPIGRRPRARLPSDPDPAPAPPV